LSAEEQARLRGKNRPGLSRARPLAGLTERTLARGVAALVRVDADLARVRQLYGPPPLWAREPGFPTLVHIILEQQVSLASARAAFDRLLALASPLTPESFLALDDAALRAAYFSRQKAEYCRGLAHAVAGGELDLEALRSMEDDAVRSALTKVRGVGPWTAEIYLLMALGRADAWPAGDLALAEAAREVKRLPSRPTPEELIRLAEGWRPLRAVAARLLWHHYLSRPKGTARPASA
jgi:DNA-3-methyladenine glycosylase II